jgi:galactokinase
MLISFNPLKTQDVTLPVGSAFVVTHSLTEVNKAATDHFNIRVSECRLATQVKRQKNICFLFYVIYFMKDFNSCKRSGLAFDS